MKKLLKVIFILVFFINVSACQITTLEIFVTNYPTQFIVEYLVEDNAKVTNISIGRQANRSTFDKSALDQMGEGDLLFRINQLEPYLEIYRSTIESKGVQIIDLAADSTIRSAQGITRTYESLELIDGYRQEPFLWMDPLILNSLAKTVLENLVLKMPDKALQFEQRFSELNEELIILDASYQKLKTLNSIHIATLTPAFNLWKTSYNIQVYPIVLSRFGAIPNEGQLDVIKRTLTANQVHILVSENGQSSDISQLGQDIAQELSLSQIVLHDLFALSDYDRLNQRDYFSIMHDNLETLIVLAESN